MFCLCVLIGGGTQVGLAADFVLELASLPLLALALLRIGNAGQFRNFRFPVAIVAAVGLLAVIQIVPLPPMLWSRLPSGAEALDAFDAANLVLPWRPISLSPHATLYALYAMLPPAAIFLSVLSFDAEQRFALLIGPMLLGAISVLLGLAQLFGHDPKSISFFQTAHVGYAIGFFANRNHFAALLYSLLPLAVVWTFSFSGRRQSRKFAALIFGGAVVGILLIGLSVAFSRAGATLGVVAAFASLPLVWRSREISPLGRWVVAVAALGLLAFAILLQLGLIDLLLQRTTEDIQRQLLVSNLLEAIKRLGVSGTGFGTFVPVYMSFEHIADIQRFFANHAHNDWLEIALEGGVLAVLLMLAFLYWFTARAWSVWRRGAEADWVVLARASSIAIGLLLLHSLLDYPLRTTALLSIFSYCCATLVAPSIHRQRQANPSYDRATAKVQAS